MVGSSILRNLKSLGHDNILICSRQDLDLRNQSAVDAFFKAERPDQVYLAAAKVGGIVANSTLPADFIYDNLMIACNVINAAFRNGVGKLLFLGSSCIYPREASQPMVEEALLTGLLEPTNEPYAIAKIAGIKLCQSYNRQYGLDYRCVMPTNLYGPGDNYHPEHSHVIPALIRRFHHAKSEGQDVVSIWGTGNPRREFLHVDDLAKASIHVMNLDNSDYLDVVQGQVSHLNIGYGSDITIRELASMIQEIVGFEGKIQFDQSKPDGAEVKLIDSSRLRNLGWEPQVDLYTGLQNTYAAFLRETHG